MKGERKILIPSAGKALLKGRSKELLGNRNKLLVVRYYYHTEIKRMRFDDVIKTLSEKEFFIASQTIINLLGRVNDDIGRLIESRPSVAEVRKLSGSFAVIVTQKEKERYEKNL